MSIYFGAGCFWHAQYKLIKAEQQLLGRTDDELTAVTGYAGGTGLNTAGKVCYPYASREGDFGLHHAEVVRVSVPIDRVRTFAAAYWGLFKGVNRVDIEDIGPLYRSVVGLPGGMNSKLLPEFNEAQSGVVSQTFQLKEGHGGDADTLGQPLVWIMDSNVFHFYQAERHHQFHDGLVGTWPPAYHALKKGFMNDCRVAPTGCRKDAAPADSKCAAAQTVRTTTKNHDCGTVPELSSTSMATLAINVRLLKHWKSIFALWCLGLLV